MAKENTLLYDRIEQKSRLSIHKAIYLKYPQRRGNRGGSHVIGFETSHVGLKLVSGLFVEDGDFKVVQITHRD